jgi:3-methyl-2-oxobutanoate hydroxymethyltransferase
MIHHVKAAARGVSRALLVADMPFQSYETAPWQAAQAAGRFIKEAGAQAVKVEGGARIAASIKAMLDANIPVMGHLGLTPQSINKDGGYRVKGRESKEAAALLHDARLLEKLGVFAIVLEGVPAALGRKVTKALKIPTIGIGAGPNCDGQILVFDDVVGLSEGHSPKFVKKFANVRPQLFNGVKSYLRDVKARRFPTSSTSYN